MKALSKKVLIWLSLIVGLSPLSAAESDASIAVVVNAASPLSDISILQLKALYEGSLVEIGRGQQLTLGEFSALSERFYSRVLEKSLLKVRKLWIKNVLSGSSAVPPKQVAQVDDVIEFLQKTPSAICFLEYNQVPDDVKVLRINGLYPTAPGYPLR